MSPGAITLSALLCRRAAATEVQARVFASASSSQQQFALLLLFQEHGQARAQVVEQMEHSLHAERLLLPDSARALLYIAVNAGEATLLLCTLRMCLRYQVALGDAAGDTLLCCAQLGQIDSYDFVLL
jgi:hypothetical protein